MQRAWHGWGRGVGALVLAVVPAAGLLQAAPGAQSPPGEATQPQDEALRKLVNQLDADTLQLRQQASDELLAAGTDAISPLMAALPRSSAETTMRGLAILKKLAQSTDAETKQKARSALEQLARSDQPSLAAQAAAIVKAQDPFARSTVRVPGQIHGGLGGFQVFQLQMMNGGPATRRIVAHENGQTVVIAESREKTITVSVTARVGNKNQTTTVTAESSEDLERKSPQAAALYRKYRAGGGMDFPVGGFPGGNPLIAPGGANLPQPSRRLEKPRSPPTQKP